jgi:hypothetical protein
VGQQSPSQGSPLILRRNIDIRCNGRLKPYTIACGILPQRRAQARHPGNKNDLLLDLL